LAENGGESIEDSSNGGTIRRPQVTGKRFL